MRSRLGYTPFVILAPLVVLTAMIIFWIAAQVRHTLSHLPPILEAQLTAALGREVRIGKLEGDFWHGIVLRDIAVARSGKLSGGALLRVARARVRYSLDAVLQQGAPPLESITRIELERPWIYLSRDAKGRLNLQDLVKPGKRTKAKPQRFLATVAIRDGTVVFEDHKVRGGPITHHLTGIDVDLDPRASPLIVASLRARGDAGRVARIAIDAGVNPGSKTVSIAADLKGVHVTPWLAYVPAGVHLPVTPEAGVLDAHLTALVVDGKLADYRGRVALRDAALRVPKLKQPVRGIGGTFDVSPDLLVADNIRVAAGKLSLAGTATVADFKKPWVRAHLSTTGVREEYVRELVPQIPALEGVRLGQVDNVEVSIAGPLTRPSASVRLDVASVSRPEATLSGVHLEAHLTGAKTVVVDELKGRVAKGTVSATGTVDLSGKEPGYAVRGALRGIHLDAINLSGRLGKGTPSPTGTVSADFEAAGAGAQPDAHLRLDVTDAAWKEWQLTSARADCVYHDGMIQIRRAEARAPQGLLTAYGSVDLKGPLKVEVAATDLDVGALGRKFKLEKLQGAAHVHGEVGGTLQDPSFSGELAAYNLAWGDDRLDMVRARVQGDLRQVRVEQCSGLYLPAQVGGVTATLKDPRAGADAEVEATGTVIGLDIGKLCKRFKVEGEWGGSVNVEELSVSGPANALRIEALVTARDVHGAGHNVDYASGRVVANTQGAVEVAEEEPLTIQTGTSEVQVWGTVSAERELDLWVKTAEGKSIRVEDFQSFDPAMLRLRSRLDLALHVTGPASDPAIHDGGVKILELAVNGHPFSGGQGTVDISRAAVRVNNLVLIGDEKEAAGDRGEQYELDGTVWPQKDLDVTVRVVAAPLEKLMQLGRAPKPPFPVQGKITALVKVRHGVPRPLVSLSRLDVTDGAVGPQRIRLLRAEGVDLTEDAVVVKSLKAALPEGAALELEGRASLTADGPIAFQVSGHRLDLALVQPWVSLGKPVGGVGTLEALVTGTRDQPRIEGLVSVDGPRYGDTFALDSAAARLSFRDSVAHITELVVRKDEYSASGSAEVQVDWAKKRIAPDAAIKAHIGLEEQSLNALTLFSPKVIQAEGTTSASLDVAGTLANPDLHGQILLKCKELIIGNPQPGQSAEKALCLSDVDGVIRIQRDRITVDHVRVARASIPEDGSSGRSQGAWKRVLQALHLQPRPAQVSGGDPDALKLDGWVTLNGFTPDEFHLNLAANDFSFAERNLSGQFQERVEFRLNGKGTVTERWPSPLIAGDFKLHRTKVDVQNYAAPQKVAVERVPLAVNPRFNLTLATAGDAEVLAARTRAFAKVLIPLKGSLNAPEVEGGSVLIARGGVDVSTAYFRINKGEVAFEMDPRIGFSALGNITLASNMRGKNPRTGKEESFAVTAEVAIDMPNAPEKQFVMELTASPYMEENAIYRLLTRQDVIEGIVSGKTDSGMEQTLKREAMNFMATALQPRLLEPVERTVAGLLHLNEFSIRASFEEPVEVKVGKHLVKNLRVSYTRSVSAREARYKFKVDYDLREGISLSWTTDEKRSRTFGLEAGYQF